MLPGLAGHLISQAYLETHLQNTRDHNSPAIERTRKAIVEWRGQCERLGPASGIRAMLDDGAAGLAFALGFEPPSDVDFLDDAVAATLRGQPQPVAVLVTQWDDRLDRFWRTAVHQAIQRSASWCVLFNGTHIRLVDARRLFARRHLEFELDSALNDPRSLAAFVTVINAQALTTSLAGLVTSSDQYAAGVCRSLKDGVMTASTDVLAALVARTKTRPGHMVDGEFEQALTIVYRMVFLLFAEARGLVPMWHPVYRESYSLDSLRVTAEQPRGAPGVWDALRAIARLAHAGCRAGDLRVTPFNGRLFAPARTPLADRRDLDNEAARRAILALSTRLSPDRAGRQPIAYRDLGVEQLGAVYETLLDYEPRVEPAAAPHTRRVTVTLARGSGVRKETGSFYTPQPIAEYIVRRTLGPLVHDAAPEQILQLRIVDQSMGSGAFLVAACRYLASAYEAALVRGQGCRESDISESERAGIRRTIAERCLYGVDLNPMAVQLARLSLWLTTLAADRPLSFLDHRLQVGNSLLGAWLTMLGYLPDRRRKRQTTAAQVPLFEPPGFQDVLRNVLPVRFSLESIPNDTVQQIRAKEQALAAMNRRDSSLTTWKRIADLWCASWFSDMPRAAFGSLCDFLLNGGCALPTRTVDQYLRTSEEIARSHRFFHWELEFPEVFFDADGHRLANAGFDAVIGNPPWDMLRGDAGPAEARARAKSAAGLVVRFSRDAGVYNAQSDGHANRYQLFLERAVALTRSGGRIGLVLPWGLATDRGSAPLRRLLFTRCDVDAIVGFDNRRGVFPIHRSVRFLLLTASAGRSTDRIACRLGVEDASELESIGEEPARTSSWFPVRIASSLLQRVSGDDITLPWFRTPVDVAIVERVSALFPPLGDERGWSARFGRELNATDDRRFFSAPGTGLPIVEGKQIEPFAVDLKATRYSISRRDAARLLRARHYDRPRLGYRDVAGATNRLTLIAALLPAGCASTHTIFCLRTPLSLVEQHFLCGLFNSFVVNYLVRSRVTTHVTTALVERLPIPTRRHAPAAVREIAALARHLARRPDPVAFARLQARVAELYQLSTDEFAHILSTFPLMPQRDRDAALRLVATETQRTRR